MKNRTAEPEGSGPYWPSWQRTPVNKGRQQLINLNFAHAKVFLGALPVLLEDPKVIINRISVPLPQFFEQVTGNLRASQYRNRVDEYLLDPMSYMAYPVFDSFNATTRKVAGALISTLYWRLYFQSVLPPTAKGIICVIENSFNEVSIVQCSVYAPLKMLALVAQILQNLLPRDRLFLIELTDPKSPPLARKMPMIQNTTIWWFLKMSQRM